MKDARAEWTDGTVGEWTTDGPAQPNGLPPVEDISELISEPIVLPPDVIHGLLDQGGKMVLGGGSKTFKTWQFIDLGGAVSTGAGYLGFPTTKGRVLYINLELMRGHFSWRTKTVMGKKRGKLECASFDVWNLRGYAADLSKLMPEMSRQASVNKYAVIIVDPIYKVFGLHQENVMHDVAWIMNELEKLAVKTGAAVVFGAHFSKGNQSFKESIDRISGSGVFARDPDSILTFTRHKEENAYTVEATLRNHPPVAPFVVRWEFPLMVRDETLDPEDLKQPGGRPVGATPSQLLDLFEDKIRAGEWQKLAEEKLGLSRRTFYEMLAKLKDPKHKRVEKIGPFYTKCEKCEN